MTEKIFIHKEMKIGEVEKSIFGSFIEHMGRAIYGGIYEPGHFLADEDGFRKDVIDVVRELGVSNIRYPGGNFLSGYNWKNGIGPKKNRVKTLDLAWRQLEPNEIGVDEFMSWLKKVGSAPIMGVNMGTGAPMEAAELVEYCNHLSGSYWSDLRIQNGRKEPYGIKYWCIGNEMDGDWQICALTAEEYGKKANESAKIMKIIDPQIKLVVCGSSSPELSTYPEWDRIVLEQCYENVDFLSLHRYYSYNDKGSLSDFLASPVDFEKLIKTGIGIADYVKTLKRSSKILMLSLDEWNVWHRASDDYENTFWQIGPAREENSYDMADALVVSGLLSVLINHSDRVKIACLAQLVNVIAPIMTKKGEGVLKQTTYYPFQLFSKFAAQKTVLKTVSNVSEYESVYGKTPSVFVSVCYDEEKKQYFAFLTNVCAEIMKIDLDFCSDEVSEVFHIEMNSRNIHDKNTFEQPEKILPRTVKPRAGSGRVMPVMLPPYSFSVIGYSSKK